MLQYNKLIEQSTLKIHEYKYESFIVKQRKLTILDLL